MSASFAEFGRRLESVVDRDALHRIGDDAGDAARDAFLDVAGRDYGGDRRMSGMGARGPELDVSVDRRGEDAEVELRPGALWRLAESGRRSSGTIRPVNKRALRTPQGPRASSTYGPTSGKQSYSAGVARAHDDAGRAAHEQFQHELRRAF